MPSQSPPSAKAVDEEQTEKEVGEGDAPNGEEVPGVIGETGTFPQARADRFWEQGDQPLVDFLADAAPQLPGNVFQARAALVKIVPSPVVLIEFEYKTHLNPDEIWLPIRMTIALYFIILRSDILSA